MVRGPGIFFRDKVRGPGICRVSPWSQGWAKCAWTETCSISLIFLPCLWVRRPWGIWGWGAVAELKWKPGHAQVPLPASHSSLYWTPGRNIVLTHHFHPCWSLPAGDEPCMGRSRAVNSRSYPQGLDDSLNAPNICWRSFFVEQMIDWMNDSLELLCDSCCFSHFILREQNPHNYKGKYNKFQCICSGN